MDIHITGRCNMNCDFCCGAPKRFLGPNLLNFQKVINKIKKVGVSTLVFTGGEPLLKPKLDEFIRYAYNQGLEIYLSSNGLLLTEEKYKSISSYLTVLGLPLDGSSEEMNQKMGRNPQLFKNTLRLLEYFKQNPPSHKVKIGTIVSSINKDDIINIGRLLFRNKKYYQPDVWRLYEFSPLGKGKKYKFKYTISHESYNSIVKSVKRKFVNANISPLSNEDSNDSYFFITPVLHLQILSHNRYIDLGSLLDIDTKKLKKIISIYQKVREKGSNNRIWIEKNQ